MLSGVVFYTSMLGVASCVEIRCVFVYSRLCQLKYGSLVHILYGEGQLATLFSGVYFFRCVMCDVGARGRLVTLVLYL